MTGYWRCLVLNLRTALAQVLGWPLAVTVLAASTAATLNGMYPDQAGRDAYGAAYVGLRSSAALQGRGYDLTSLGGILANEMGYLTLIMIPLIGLHLAIKFTRGVEDTGRLDILTAGPVNRLAPVAAGVTTAAVPAALTVLFTTGALVALDFPVAGSLLYAGGLGALMLTFTAIGAVVAQCCRDARTAYVLGTAIWMTSYLTRAVVDARGIDVAWANPESWLAEIRPFAATPTLWPWIAFAAFSFVLFIAAAAVAARRDQGAGLIPPRPGPATAAPWIKTPLRLLVRLTLGTGAGWIIAASLFAFAFGYLTQQMSDIGTATSADQNINATLAIFVQMNALLAAAAGTQLTQWLAAEENAGRVGYSLAGPTSRRRWWGSATLLVTAWSLLLLLCTSLFTGLGLAAGFNDTQYIGRGLTATMAYAPAVVLFVVMALALHAVSPRAVAMAWLAVGWGVIVCLRADLLDLPEWARNLSPLHWMGAVPRDDWNQLPALIMTVLAAALVVAATAVYERRDLRAG